MPLCVPRSAWSHASSGSDGHGEGLDGWRPNCPPRGRQWKTYRTGCNNIWRRTSPSTTETNAGGLKLSTTERTISNGSLLPWDCRPARPDLAAPRPGGQVGRGSIETMNCAVAYARLGPILVFAILPAKQ